MTMGKRAQFLLIGPLWLLAELFAEYGGADKTCLDFACGTGRITSLLEPSFGSDKAAEGV